MRKKNLKKDRKMQLSELIKSLQVFESEGHGKLNVELYVTDFSNIENIYLMSPEEEDKFIAIRG